MTNSQPPLSPNSAVGTPASPVPKWSSFHPIEAPASPSSPTQAYSPQPHAAPLSPVSPYSTSSSSVAPWSPATTASSPSGSPSGSSTRRQTRRYDENDDGIQDLFIDRSLTDHYRLQAAKHRSLTLLDTHAEGNPANRPTTSSASLSANRMNLCQAKELSHQRVKNGASRGMTWIQDDVQDEGDVKHTDTKGFIDRSMQEEVRLHGSKQRSLALLETYAESARRAPTKADKEYQEKMKSIPREDEVYDNQATHRRKSMHNMASSTRPKKALTAEDVRDPETVAGMKSQLDLDRERAAEKKALLLLDIMAMF